jgi:hypothetical protein
VRIELADGVGLWLRVTVVPCQPVPESVSYYC